MMQIDRPKKINAQVLTTVGKSKFKQYYLDGNEKIIDYYEGKPCPKCKMLMDVGEKGICQYCYSVLNGGNYEQS